MAPVLATDSMHCASPADHGPLVFVEKLRGRLILAAVNRPALASGLLVGMPLADARAQLPDILIEEHDPAGDALWLEAAADACERFSPMLAIAQPDAVVLDITGCAHLFGSESALATAAETLLVRRGLQVRHALADTPEAALALARYQTVPAASECAALLRLPIAALGLDEAVETGLRRAGLKTVGDLAARPTQPLSARFGKATVLALDRLLGRVDSRISPRRPPPPVHVERRFAEPMAQTEAMLAVLGELLAEACAKLSERGKGGRRFHARLYRSDGAVRDLSVETGRPVRDAPLVLRLLRERIDALADPLDPGFGFDLIRLAVPALEPLGPDQLRLEGGGAAQEQMAGLLDRLGARAGSGRFRRLQPRDTHIPEQAVLALPVVEGGASHVWPDRVEQGGDPPARPMLMFDPPQRIEVVAEVPDGPPHRFRWDRKLHEVVRFEGPERIAPEWWTRPVDAPGLTRDYYRVEDSRGRRFWLFRHGLYGGEQRHPGWYLHGLFA